MSPSMNKKVATTGESGLSAAASKPNTPKLRNDRPAGDRANVIPPLTHKQIEERAKAIWRQKGCPVGQDEKNWYEAEDQFKKGFTIESCYMLFVRNLSNLLAK